MSTTWVTAGEAKGLLTMPPDRECIWVGSVAIQLGDEGRASATGYEIVMNPVGMTTSKLPVGPTKVYLGCEVEAETREEALALAHPIMEEALDLVALASGAAVGPVRVVRVVEKIEPPGTALSTYGLRYCWLSVEGATGRSSVLPLQPQAATPAPIISFQVWNRCMRSCR